MAKRTEKMGEPRSIRFPQSFLDRVEEWRATQRPIPQWGDAIRKLAEAGLQAIKERPEKKGRGK
ncbi:MAG: hypothetical protein J2P50_18385 [Hyphomicrobiaceae bacterium]|nr:hypothetical protein [Hyphomicrobiaceae bacterium]